MRAVAYLRVSTTDQAGADRYGLPAQRESIERYAEAQGLEVAAWYADEGISGATLDRPGLQDLMAAAAEGAFDVVLVAKLDRVARDLFTALFVEKELLLNGVEIVSIAEPFNGDDPMQTAFRQMTMTFAQLEKAMIAQRLKGGRRAKARGGGYAGGGPAIGYTAERGSKALQVDRQKVATVRRAFELRQEQPGATLQQVADTLNREGHTTAQGKQFQPTTIKRILERQEFYQGQYIYSDIKAQGQHYSII